MKYTIGNYVKIVDDLKRDEEYDVVTDMVEYAGKVGKIVDAKPIIDTFGRYRLTVDHERFWWHESLLEPVNGIPLVVETKPESETTVVQQIDMSGVIEQLADIKQCIVDSREHNPYEQAMIDGIIEKAKTIATKDLENSIKDNLCEFIKNTFGVLPKERIEIVSGNDVRTIDGLFHKQFKDILTMVKCGLNPLISGGAGCGKTYLCEQISEALGYSFMFTGAVTQEHKLLGYCDANGVYHETQFYKWCTTPNSLFMFDEFDASDNNAILTINTALANGYVDFPCVGRVDIPKQNVFIASANTIGNGADCMYVGRNQLDSATIDRFTFVEFEYDDELESQLAYDDELFEFIHQLRCVIEKKGLNELVSMRATIYATDLLNKSDMSKEKILKYTIIKSMSQDTINIIARSDMFNEHNIWFKTLKKLSD